MSFLRWTPRASRRFYSANNASKFGGGGGRFSAKGSKAAAVTGQTKVSTNRTGSSLKPDDSSPSPRPSKNQPQQSQSTSPTSFFGESHGPVPPITTAIPPIPTHPFMSHGELKMHQLFALHRPMLLYTQPVYRHFEAMPLMTDVAQDWWAKPRPTKASPVMIDDPPEATSEADADAARVLSRQLVINRVGLTMEWDATLKRLGLHGEEIGEQERVDMAKELEAVKTRVAGRLRRRIWADSVKRKRKKKMKKHKLRKRRKADKTAGGSKK